MRHMPDWTTTEAAARVADALLELIGTKCPLCEHVIVDGEISRPGGSHRRFIARWDLGGAVCERCDRELGPDEVRLQAMRLSPNAEAMVAKYMEEWGAGTHEEV